MDVNEAKIYLLTLEKQGVVASMEAIERIGKTLEALEKMKSGKDIPKSWLLYDKGWEAPNGEEIRETFRPYTGSQVAKMLGITNARTVRKWIGEEPKIPYASWRLFLILTGRVI